ncbi:MAG: zinc ribbon domain-containing protein [Candidatus Hodarchaeota archaeon]
MKQFHTVREAWTSKTCSKCGSTNTTRPFQSLVNCQECGANVQADINGAMNIAFRLIKSFKKETTFDHWFTKPLHAEKYPAKSERVVGAISPSINRNEVSPIVYSGD